MMTCSRSMETPVGKLTLVADEAALLAIAWEDEEMTIAQNGKGAKAKEHPILDKVERQLAEYFSGQRREFDLPLRPKGTEFQTKVWQALRKIPYGTLWSYGQLAREVGQPTAARAVGAANGKNPLPIVVPCHRVIGQNGTLTGFGGGLKNKATLIAIEQRVAGKMLV